MTGSQTVAANIVLDANYKNTQDPNNIVLPNVHLSLFKLRCVQSVFDEPTDRSDIELTSWLFPYLVV